MSLEEKSPRTLHYTLLKISHFADFEHVIIKISYFADFEHVIIKLVILLTLNESSNTINKTPLGETGCLSIFLFFVECLGIQFFDSPHPSPITSSLNLPWAIATILDPFYTFSPAHRRVIHDFALPTLFTVSTTDLRERFLLSGVFYLALLIPREAEDCPSGGNHSKHMPPPTFLAWLQLIYCNF